MADTRQLDQERLEYVRAMLTELQRLVVADRHPTLSYLLEMAKLEVCDIVDGNDESGGGQE